MKSSILCTTLLVLLYTTSVILASPTRELPGTTTIIPTLDDEVATTQVPLARQDEDDDEDEEASATTPEAPVVPPVDEQVAEEEEGGDEASGVTERATTLRTPSTTAKQRVPVPNKTSFQEEWAIVTGLGPGSSQPNPPKPSDEDDNDQFRDDATQRSISKDSARQDVTDNEDESSPTEQAQEQAVTEKSQGNASSTVAPSSTPAPVSSTTEDDDDDDDEEEEDLAKTPKPVITLTSPAPVKKIQPALNTTNFVKEWSFVTGDEVLSDPQARAGCECGKVPFQVPGGGVNEWPWTAAIVKSGIFAGGRPHCGATLINSRYVLTAAHCVDGLLPFRTEVWLTVHDNLISTGSSSGTQKLLVERILMHPNYNRRTGDNDIALVAFSEAVSIGNSNYFVPACVPAGRNDYSGIMAKMAAWGSSDLGPSNTRIKNNRICKAEMPILSNEVCDRDTTHMGKITRNMMCAGYITPTNDLSCVSDAGGGLVISNGGRHTVVGIASFGYSPNRAYSPTVHTRVSEYAEWILHNTRDADWCD